MDLPVGSKIGRWTIQSVKVVGKYSCLCDCGKLRDVLGSNLVAGKSNSCGCIASDINRSKRDVGSLSGTRFGRLVAEEMEPGTQFYWCRCDCGARVRVHRGNLLQDHSRSCGCERLKKSTKGSNYTGRKFGRLLLIRKESVNPQVYTCLCECGEVISVKATVLRSGGKNSCGCLKGDVFNGRAPVSTRPKKLYNAYKNSALKRGLEFNISLQDFVAVLAKMCAYCGRHGGGADRIDSDVGYIKQNLAPCCPRCNVAKSSSTVDEFREWIRMVYARLDMF